MEPMDELNNQAPPEGQVRCLWASGTTATRDLHHQHYLPLLSLLCMLTSLFPPHQPVDRWKLPRLTSEVDPSPKFRNPKEGL